MAKWMCGMCGRVEDEEIGHGSGEVDWEGDPEVAMRPVEIECGPWLDVTPVFRTGQEEMRATVAAAAKEVARSWGGIDAYADDLEERLLALPLEGDDESK